MLRRLLPVVVFLAIFVVHALYVGSRAVSPPSGWTDDGVISNAAGSFGLRAYWLGQDYFIGFSYGLGAAFATWALGHCVFSGRQRSIAAGAAASGITFVGILMAGGCFLIGCCGSPMLAVYLSLFGAKALGLGKPLTALFTLASVGCSYWCLSRRFARGGACVDACCSAAGAPSKIARTEKDA